MHTLRCWWLLVPLVMILASGCARKQEVEAVDESNATPVVAPDSEPESRQLKFRVTKVHTGQKLKKTAPYFQTGGDWTFMECETGIRSRAKFTLGVRHKPAKPDEGNVSGKAMLIVEDAAAGEKLLDLFAKEFPQKLPSKPGRDFSPKPLNIETSVWSQNVQRDAKGQMSTDAGKWTALACYLKFDDRFSEIALYYNLDAGRGEFTDADMDESYDLLKLLAAALRDGPRPLRTPETDTNLTLAGPKFGKPQEIAKTGVSEYAFSPNGKYAVYSNNRGIYAVWTDDPDPERRQLAICDRLPGGLHVVNDDLDLLFYEQEITQPDRRSYELPNNIWWLDGKTGSRKRIFGPIRSLYLERSPYSPDGRFVAIGYTQRSQGDQSVSHWVVIVDRETGQSRDFSLSDKNLGVVGWKETSDGWRAVCVSNRWQPYAKETEIYWADPIFSGLERKDSDDVILNLHEPLAPDGKLRLKMTVDDLLITDVASGKQRRFAIHEDDRDDYLGSLTSWVSPRYLVCRGRKLAFIDVETMKMSYPYPTRNNDNTDSGYVFSPDFRWVMYQGAADRGEGLMLAPVELPAEK